MDTTINMQDVETGGFEPLPADDYRCKIEKVTAGLSKNNNQKWDVQLRVTEGEFSNRVLFDTWTFSTKAMPVVKSKLQVISPEMAESSDIDFETGGNDLLGIEVIARVDIQHTEGYDPQNRIKKYVALDA